MVNMGPTVEYKGKKDVYGLVRAIEKKVDTNGKRR